MSNRHFNVERLARFQVVGEKVQLPVVALDDLLIAQRKAAKNQAEIGVDDVFRCVQNYLSVLGLIMIRFQNAEG